MWMDPAPPTERSSYPVRRCLRFGVLRVASAPAIVCTALSFYTFHILWCQIIICWTYTCASTAEGIFVDEPLLYLTVDGPVQYCKRG